MQLFNAARLISLFGCRKNGMENREVCHISRGGFTTRCVVDFSLLFVRRCNMSPTFTTICSGNEVTPTQSPCLVKICKPSADAPTNKVIRLMSSCCSARMEDFGSPLMGG